jgi:hypothetical protein
MDEVKDKLKKNFEKVFNVELVEGAGFYCQMSR